MAEGSRTGLAGIVCCVLLLLLLLLLLPLCASPVTATTRLHVMDHAESGSWARTFAGRDLSASHAQLSAPVSPDCDSAGAGCKA